MNILKRILLARFEIQTAIGGTISLSVLVVAASGVEFDPEPVYAIGAGLVTAIFFWMAVVSRIIYGKSLEELDEAVNARAAESVQAAVAKQIPKETLEGRQSLDAFLNEFLSED